MKISSSTLLLVPALTFLFSCSKDPAVYSNIDYSKYVTIDQGLWGSCIFREGNWQPFYDKSAIEYPVKRTIYIYQLTSTNQVDPTGANNSYNQINTTLVAQTQSDEIGFYQIELQPGQYSILIKEDGNYYCTCWDGQGNICPVTINNDTTTEKNLLIDYKAVY